MNAKQRRRFNKVSPKMAKFMETIPHFSVKNPTPEQEQEALAFMESSKELAKLLKHLPALRRGFFRALHKALK